MRFGKWRTVLSVFCVAGMSVALFGQEDKAGSPKASSGNGKRSVNVVDDKAGTPAVGAASGQFQQLEKGTREITILEDRDQDYMTSKVYILQHVKAADMRPFILGAVRRANLQSNVQRLNYKAGGKQYLVVNMPVWMVEYVDDMVAKLDRAPADPKKDVVDGSVIAGTGITRWSYRPKYRATQDIMNIIHSSIFLTGETAYYLDPASNLIYGKNSASDSADVAHYVDILDRPVPQVEMTIKLYEVNVSELMELGLDYINWKNGPGADILNVGSDLLKFDVSQEFVARVSDLIAKGSHSWAGFLVAPDFDASFLRMLAQKGKARVATSGSITVANDYADPGFDWNAATYRLGFTPQFQNISKNGRQEISVSNDTNVPFRFHLRSPVICYRSADDPTGAIMTFGWVLTNSSVMERDNVGREAVNTNTIQSFLSLAPGGEKLIASFDRREDVNQNNGMPFLTDIPGLKYLFGSTTDSNSRYKVFVTIETRPLPIRADLSAWAGRVIDVTKTALEIEKKSDGQEGSAAPEETPAPETADDIQEVK